MKKSLVSAAISLLIATIVAACGGGDGGSSPAGDEAVFKSIPENGSFADAANDATVDFVDITGAVVTITSTDIVFEITVRNLPASLNFNQPGVPLNVLEYRWAVFFDTDNDDAADYSMSAGHYKLSDSTVSGGIVSNTQAAVWQHEGAAVVQLLTVQSSLTGTTLRLSVLKAEYPELVNITSSAKVKIETYYMVDIRSIYTDSI